MTQQTVTPFDSIESAHDFVTVLAEAVAEAKQEIQLDLERELNLKSRRRGDALRIAEYNLEKLETHMIRSRRILNDLRSLRRLLFAERESVAQVLARNQTPVAVRGNGDATPTAPKPAAATNRSNGNAQIAIAA